MMTKTVFQGMMNSFEEWRKQYGPIIGYVFSNYKHVNNDSDDRGPDSALVVRWTPKATTN